MRSVPPGDRGAVTAEFALALPVLLAVLMLAVGSILLATHRVTLASAAAEVARLEARGDMPAARQRLAGLGSGIGVTRSRDGPLLCIALRMHPVGGLLSAIAVSATACAAVSEASEAAVVQ